MSHAVEYATVSKKSDVMKEAKDFAYYNVDRIENPCREYHGDMTIVESKICDSVEDADEYLKDKFDHHDYRDGAVRFHDLKAVQPTKKMLDLQRRISENYKAKEEYLNKNVVQNRESKSITCTCCGSRLTLSYLHGQRCPLCSTDLRSATVQNRIKKFDSDQKKLNKEYAEAEKKLKSKAPIKWRVKVEVHC